MKVLLTQFRVDHVQELFGAGTETASTTVEWAMAELVAHPELMQRAQEEIDAVVGSNRLVQDSDLPKLTFLQACVKETFRLHAILPLGLPRESTAPVEAMGYKIPAETKIIYNMYSIHRDPAAYDSPNEFNPDRFLQQNRHVSHLAAFDSYELIPFGPGRRMCPGSNLGNMVVHFLLANLIHSYDWSVPPGGHLDTTEDKKIGFILYLKDTLTLVPKLRDGVPAF